MYIVKSLPKPLISVIVIAYNRKDYLIEAFNSVLSQDLDKSIYDIIVVKNFVDSDMDNYITNNGGKIKNSTETSLGSKIIQGIQSSESKIICILEDDDLYEASRLAHIKEIFDNRPDLTYYHNGVNFVNKTNRLISDYSKPQEINRMERIGCLDFVLKGKNIPNIVFTTYADFNLSSMAFSKEAVLPYLKTLENRNTIVDSFIFFICLKSNGRILLESIPLTRYRVHDGNASFYKKEDTTSGRYIERLNTISNGYKELYQLFRGNAKKELPRKISQLYFVSNIMISLNKKRTRLSVLKSLLYLFSTGGVQYIASRKDSMYYAFLYMVSPTMAIKSYHKRHLNKISPL